MRWFLLILFGSLLLAGCEGESRTLILQGGSMNSSVNITDTNETVRVEMILGSWINTTSVNDSIDARVVNISASVNDTNETVRVEMILASWVNDTNVNDSIDLRGLNLTLPYQNVTGIPNCSNDEYYLTMVDGVLSCDPDDVGVDTTCDGGTCDIANTGTLDGFEGSDFYLASNPLNFINESGGVSFLDVTSESYTGEILNDTIGGYIGANQECNEEFLGSHLCNMAEILEYIAGFNMSLDTDAWASQFGPKYVPADIPVNDCNGWTHGVAGTYLGNYFHFDSTEGGDARAINCGTSLPLACCK